MLGVFGLDGAGLEIGHLGLLGVDGIVALLMLVRMAGLGLDIAHSGGRSMVCSGCRVLWIDCGCMKERGVQQMVGVAASRSGVCRVSQVCGGYCKV